MPVVLPDPRCYAPPDADPFVALAQQDAASAMQRPQPAPALVNAYRDALARNDEEGIRASLRNATSARVARTLWAALDRALQPAGEAVALQLFALPLLVVTGGRAGATVPGVLPDVQRLQQVLAAAGALGPSQSFGLGNALCAPEALASIPWSRLRALQSDPDAGTAAALELAPDPIHTATSEEEVHLRFIAGAAIVAAGAPSFVETGAAIGAWGMAMTRELADQLRVEGLTVLPIPRAPASVMNAQVAGAVAREELAVQAFVARVLRRFRSEIGEPQVALAALASGAIGLRFTSAFVENRVSVHRRALHITEDLDEAVRGIVLLLRECGVEEVGAAPEVMPDDAFARHPEAPAH